MDSTALTALSPLDGRYSARLDKLRGIFSEYALMRFRVLVEIAWLKKLSAHPHISEVPVLTPEAVRFLDDLTANFSLADAAAIKEIESITNHDVKAVEYFIKERIRSHPQLGRICEFVHFACTSEDINGNCYALMLHTARNEIIMPLTQQLTAKISAMAHNYAAVPLLGHTHGQAASPTTIGKELANVVSRLNRQRSALAAIGILGKMNGAVGNFNAHVAAYPELDWRKFAEEFVTSLGLDYNSYTTQIEPHDYMAEIFHALIRFNTIMLDFDRDIWGYIAMGVFRQKAVEGEVGSSTMPHKVNPIDFENSEGNLGLANALLHHLADKLPISRFQRDLSDSTVLRNLGIAIGYSVLAWMSTLKGLERLQADAQLTSSELNANWEILAEPYQTIMRRYGVENAYEQLKEFTRGRQLNREAMQEFVLHLDLPEEARQALLNLTPDNYLGLAEQLARDI